MAMIRAVQDGGLVLLALVGMEGVAWATHRFLMHGPLWVLHRSHHEPRAGRFELNDLFAFYFALPSIAMVFWGRHGWPPAEWLGWGMTGYGVIYALFHDGLVHNRFRSPLPLRLMKRLVQAHRLHHVVTTKKGAVSYGFLWAPPVRVVKLQLQAAQGIRAPVRPKPAAEIVAPTSS
ncbi:sterol desaturase family protein [Caulobacter sp. S45]|uniref:sterol desaturase family protein n=1 Tax=Caulobacter sp. S45 TaxID=1641861 RepID=UPI0020C68957|nr:sterol desaturase family protein [Caulobacter sp. S45]